MRPAWLVFLPGRTAPLYFAVQQGHNACHLIAAEDVAPHFGLAPENGPRRGESLCGKAYGPGFRTLPVEPIVAFTWRLCPDCHAAGINMAVPDAEEAAA